MSDPAVIRTLADEWRGYRDKVYPHGMGADQNKELHMAFFAGALVALKLSIEETADLPTEKAVPQIAALINEAKATCECIVAPYRAARN